jgi:NTP pyrophosphatase (non-canonical NTP hydrolase)
MSQEAQTRMCFENYIKNSFEDELADVVIRIMDLCGYLHIDLEAHILAKMQYNATREKLHGKRY